MITIPESDILNLFDEIDRLKEKIEEYERILEKIQRWAMQV
jgi:hypothetical protein